MNDDRMIFGVMGLIMFMLSLITGILAYFELRHNELSYFITSFVFICMAIAFAAIGLSIFVDLWKECKKVIKR